MRRSAFALFLMLAGCTYVTGYSTTSSEVSEWNGHWLNVVVEDDYNGQRTVVSCETALITTGGAFAVESSANALFVGDMNHIHWLLHSDGASAWSGTAGGISYSNSFVAQRKREDNRIAFDPVSLSADGPSDEAAFWSAARCP